MKALDITSCLNKAGQAFAGWWILLCIVSGSILLTQAWIPYWLMGSHLKELAPFYTAYTACKQDIITDPAGVMTHITAFEEQIFMHAHDPEIQAALWATARKLVTVIGLLFLIALVLQLVMIILSKASVQPKKRRTLRRNTRQSLILLLSYAVLAVIKIIPFTVCILPGFYVYVRLYFTGYIITEESPNPFRAMEKSWRMTGDNIWRIMLLFLITIGIDIFSLITIIAFIPGTSFKYTLRAAAYEQLRKEEEKIES